jgi:hypothetical protein
VLSKKEKETILFTIYKPLPPTGKNGFVITKYGPEIIWDIDSTACKLALKSFLFSLGNPSVTGDYFGAHGIVLSDQLRY